jgi:hypothetical protein
MMNPIAETAMNLIGLILIAALSGGIVAVSLRLRTSLSSDRLWLDGERVSDDDLHPRSHGGEWLRSPFGLKSEPGFFRAVKDQIGS